MAGLLAGRILRINEAHEHMHNQTHVTLAELQDPGAIERTEEEDGTVRYGSVLLLAPGVWGDAGSGRHILYSPEGIENSADNWEDNTVNLFHERENEVTDVGEVDTDSIFLGEDDGGLYGDIVLHMDNPASEFADEALQNALETGGREGLQGPSVELRGEEYDTSQQPPELVEGTFNGLGLVGLGVSPGPGSEDAAFAEQTRDRAVALAGSDEADVLTLQNNVTMDKEHVLEQLDELGISVGDDPDEELLQTLAETFEIDLQEDEEEEDEDTSEDDEGEEEEGDGGDDNEDDDDEDDVDINLEDVATRVDAIGEQVAQNTERIESIAETTEALSDQTVEIREADVSLSELEDTRKELAETVDDLQSRLSELEDTLEPATSLADIDGVETYEDGEAILQEMGPNAPGKPAFTR